MATVTRKPAGNKARRSFVRGSRRGKARKEFWLDPALLRRVQRRLGAATEREAVEIALDLVDFRDELVAGARALPGLKLTRID